MGNKKFLLILLPVGIFLSVGYFSLVTETFEPINEELSLGEQAVLPAKALERDDSVGQPINRPPVARRVMAPLKPL